MQALANERVRLIQLVEQGNIEQSEIWNQQVMAPLNAMWEDIQVIAKRNGMDQQELATLVQGGDDKKLNAYMEEHEAGPGDRHYLFGMQRDVKAIDRHKAYLRAHASELSQQSHQQMMAQRDGYLKDISARRTSAIESIAPRWSRKSCPSCPRIGGAICRMT